MRHPCECYKIGGPFIAEDPHCPEHGSDPRPVREDGECECYRIGGPFISEDPNCPEHGVNKALYE